MQEPSFFRKGETERENEREKWSWNLLPELIALLYPAGCVIAGGLDLLKKYYGPRVYSSKLLGARQISSPGFGGCLTRTMVMLSNAL